MRKHLCTPSIIVVSRVHYCNLLLARAPKTVADKLQWVVNAAAHVVSGTRKYDDGLTHLLHANMHWLNVAVMYKLALTVYKCLHGLVPDYLSELCMPVAQVAERQHLYSAGCQLLMPRCHMDTYGRRAFTVAGPMTWTLLCSVLRNPDLSIDSFRRTVMVFLCIWCIRGTVRLCTNQIYIYITSYREPSSGPTSQQWGASWPNHRHCRFWHATLKIA